MASITRTLLFQVHNPSIASRAVMHRALRAYTNAARAVLDVVSRDWEVLRAESLLKEQLNGLKLATNLRTHYRSLTVNHPMHSSLREALFADLAGAIQSYDALISEWNTVNAKMRQDITNEGFDPDAFPRPRDADIPPDRRKEYARLYRKVRALGRAPSFPTAPRTVPDYKQYEQTLDALSLDGSIEPIAQKRLDGLIMIGTRPLSFPRPDGPSDNRNFAILRSETDGRYYAMMYLLPAGDARARPLPVPPPTGKRGPLKSLNKQGLEVAPRPNRPAISMLVPLAFGSWHERTALQDAITRPESIRVAKLIHTPAHRRFHRYVPERFDLAVTFEHVVPDPAIPRAHMGIFMDERSTVHWVLHTASTGEWLDAGTDGSLVDLGMRWREDRRMQAHEGRLPPRAHHLQAEQVKHALHIMVNKIVARAVDAQALVAVCDNTYLRTAMKSAPMDEDTGKRLSMSERWHAAAAERNYRRTTLVIGEMQRILGYKLVRASLCRPLAVKGISPRDCAACGARGNERERCTQCGVVLDGMNSAAVTVKRVPEIVDRINAARAKRAAARQVEGEEGTD